MLFPASLPPSVHARAFRASNGELGISPNDVMVFLDACLADQIRVLGGELWLVDHRWDQATNRAKPASGQWCGGIPARGERLLQIIGGEGGLEDTREEIASLNLSELVEPQWQRYLRFNLTIGERG